MDLFRKNQKYVFWLVAIIIIPSFVLVWGVDRMGPGGNESHDFTVGTVNGRVLKVGEFNAFQRRLTAALGGLPLQFSRVPVPYPQSETTSSYLFAYALLQDAIAAGVTASDVQIGTYLENSHPIVSGQIEKNNPQSKLKAVDDYCRQMQITRADFLQGIREWQTIGNYIDTDNRLSVVNDDTVFAFYSLNKAEVVVKRLRFMENDDLRERAKAQIMAKSPEELEAEARNYAAGKADDPKYRTPSTWRFSWILVPFVPASSIQEPTDEEIRAEYLADRTYSNAGRSLEDAREAIVAALNRREIERQTIRNFTVDVDPQLRTQKDMSPDDLVRLPQLAKYGAVVGDTGPEGLPPAALARALPEGTTLEFASALEAIDTFPLSVRDNIINELKDGYNTASPRPYLSDKGMYRIHLIDYQPSTAAPLDGPDGSMNPELFEIALSDMVGDLAAELVRQDAAETEAKILALTAALQAGEEAPDAEFAEQFAALPTTTIPYLQIADSSYGVGTLPIGDVLEPRLFVDSETGERGQELVAMVDRRVPTRASFDSEPEDVKNRFRYNALSNYQGNYGVTYTENGPAALINPGPSIMGVLMDRYYRGGIGINPELFGNRESQG